MREVKIGIFFPDFVWPDTSSIDPLDDVRACIERCEHHGYDIWVPEHLVDAPGLYGATWLDPLVFLGYAAALTKHVTIGTNILVAPLRQPVVAAKQIATLHELSGRRFQLGIGTGWNAKEYETIGVPMKERGSRTDEVLEAIEILLTEENATFHGRHYRFEDISIHPRTGMPPVWAAGGSRRQDANNRDPAEIHPNVLRRILRAGNWMSRNAVAPEGIARDWEAICAYAREQGVDPDTINFGHVNWFHITDAKTREDALELQRGPFTRQMGTKRPFEVLQESYLMGTTSDMIERLELLIGYGCNYLCIGPTSADPNQIDLLASEIVPHLTGTR